MAIQPQINKWTMHDLKKMNISLSSTVISCPDDLFDKFQFVKKEIPTLNEDYIKIYDYAQSLFKFDFSIEDLKSPNFSLRTFMDQQRIIFADMLTKNSNEEYRRLQKELGEESLFMLETVMISGAQFIYLITEFIINWCLRPSDLPEPSYSSLFQNFSKIFNFIGSAGVNETEEEICHVYCDAVPDIIYKMPLFCNKAMRSKSMIVTVTEMKKIDVIRHFNSCTEETPEEPMPVLCQHAGQLLLANQVSFFLYHSLGIILNETKVTFTCLALSKAYTANMAQGLDDDDCGAVYFCGPYDFLKADDRKILIKTFLQFGLAQNKFLAKH